MKIVTFNVNGIRARIHQLEALVEKHQPEVIGLQEIKVENDLFPHDDIAKLGYRAYVHGQKGHYGVALLVQDTLDEADIGNLQLGYPSDRADVQRRMISFSVRYQGRPLHIYNGYFPQGENRDHPEKFPNKRRFYASLLSHLNESHAAEEQIVVMGDMNISPTDKDVGIGEHNRKRWLQTGKCSFLPEEREWYQKLYSWGLQDAWRLLNPDEDSIYSWFDYRSRGFDDDPKRGLRIDHILISSPLVARNRDVLIDYEFRAMDKPSDHCPVVCTLAGEN